MSTPKQHGKSAAEVKRNSDWFYRQLDVALSKADDRRVSCLCRELRAHILSETNSCNAIDAQNFLEILRANRKFDHMSDLAEAFIRAGLNQPLVRRQYAQALLDQGYVFPGLAVLKDLLAEDGIPPRETLEARGLIGRAYKQIYVDASDNPNKEAIRESIRAYLDVFDEDETQFWHGINAVALIARANQDQVELDDGPSQQKIAQRIVDRLSANDMAEGYSIWQLATLAEASVALGDFEAATEYLKRYVRAPEANAFKLASTLRQFEEVWQLDNENVKERPLIELLRSYLLQMPGGEIKTSPEVIRAFIANADQSETDFERVLGTTAYQNYRWLLLAMSRAESVGRVLNGSISIGTGFLLSGDSLNDSWVGRQVFVTNNHVVSDWEEFSRGLRPGQVSISFDALGSGLAQHRFKVKQVLWQSPVSEHDATILTLDQDVPVEDSFPVAPRVPKGFNEDRIYVIGYPNGGELSFSFQDNLLIDSNERLMHYRSPTDPGSSGSPVFNEAWELVGLHHSGCDQMVKLNGTGTYPANEGINISSIRAAIGATA